MNLEWPRFTNLPTFCEAPTPGISRPFQPGLDGLPDLFVVEITSEQGVSDCPAAWIQGVGYQRNRARLLVVGPSPASPESWPFRDLCSAPPKPRGPLRPERSLPLVLPSPHVLRPLGGLWGERMLRKLKWKAHTPFVQTGGKGSLGAGEWPPSCSLALLRALPRSGQSSPGPCSVRGEVPKPS